MEAGPAPLQYCEGYVELMVSSSMGINVTDGSGGMYYSNGSECYWHVSASSGERLEVVFREFDLEYTYDTVDVSPLVYPLCHVH